MGLALTLAVDVNHSTRGNSAAFPYTRFSFDWATEELQERLKAVALPLDFGTYWYFDEGVKVVSTDPYGEPLMFVLAGHLLPYLKAVIDDRAVWEKAAIAYLEALPPSTPVILYWQ